MTKKRDGMDLAELGAVFRIIGLGGSGRTWNTGYSSVVSFAILIVVWGRPCWLFDVKVLSIDDLSHRRTA